MIGPDVNLVSRVQAICSETGRSLLMSERFVKLLNSSGTTTIGRYDLRGFDEPVELYTLGNLALPGGQRPEERKVRNTADTPVKAQSTGKRIMRSPKV